jgi:hypothetical protein
MDMHEQDDFVPPGYERCPLCEVFVNHTDLVGHIRHGGCRLSKPRERELIAAGQGETPCPICKQSVARREIREHLNSQHPENPREVGKCYRYTAG